MVDRRPTVIARCRSAQDVVRAAVACAEVRSVLVVTDDEQAAAALTRLGADVQADRPDAGLNPALEHGAALDFGCGAGRLSRPLADRFRHYIGLDISEEMLANARRMNSDVPNASFVHNAGITLASIADRSIDLVY
ncbi:MAG: methyltransferase domain-containing protein, partial [Gemmatimonadetes bacterium]|nr:methyltransferase domain-containing protein [Gemmatimonadota bacterium]